MNAAWLRGNPRANKCKMMYACGDSECPKLDKPPYVCNGCPKNGNYLLERKIYSSKYADDTDRDVLVSSREGINQTPERIQAMNELLTPLIKQGQSMGHIYATHAEDLGCSRRTAYSYIEHGIFDIHNRDLRHKVKYKKRKKSIACSMNARAFRINRTYKDFQKLLTDGYVGSIAELDTVEGRKGTNPCFMTMLFWGRGNLMLIFLLKEQTQAEIKQIFDALTEALGLEIFGSCLK